MTTLTKGKDTETATPVRERAPICEARAKWQRAQAALEDVRARAAEIVRVLGDPRSPREGVEPDRRAVLHARSERPKVDEALARGELAALEAEQDYRRLVDETTAAVLAERREGRRPLLRRVFDAAGGLEAAVADLERFDSQTAVESGGKRDESPFPQFLPSTPMAENLAEVRRRYFAEAL